MRLLKGMRHALVLLAGLVIAAVLFAPIASADSGSGHGHGNGSSHSGSGAGHSGNRGGSHGSGPSHGSFGSPRSNQNNRGNQSHHSGGDNNKPRSHVNAQSNQSHSNKPNHGDNYGNGHRNGNDNKKPRGHVNAQTNENHSNRHGHHEGDNKKPDHHGNKPKDRSDGNHEGHHNLPKSSHHGHHDKGDMGDRHNHGDKKPPKHGHKPKNPHDIPKGRDHRGDHDKESHKPHKHEKPHGPHKPHKPEKPEVTPPVFTGGGGGGGGYAVQFSTPTTSISASTNTGYADFTGVQAPQVVAPEVPVTTGETPEFEGYMKSGTDPDGAFNQALPVENDQSWNIGVFFAIFLALGVGVAAGRSSLPRRAVMPVMAVFVLFAGSVVYGAMTSAEPSSARKQASPPHAINADTAAVYPSQEPVKHPPKPQIFVAQAMPTHLTVWREGDPPLLNRISIDQEPATMTSTVHKGQIVPRGPNPVVQNDPRLPWAGLPGTGDVASTVIVGHAQANPPLVFNPLTSIDPASNEGSGYFAKLELPTGDLIYRLTGIYLVPKIQTKDWAPDAIGANLGELWIEMCNVAVIPPNITATNTDNARFIRWQLIEAVAPV